MIKFAFAGKEYQTDRVIGKLESTQGPIVVLVGGMHGNEPSGVVAIREVFEELGENGVVPTGSVIGFAGNLKALEQNRRFLSCDLNRIWENSDDIADSNPTEPEEFAEREALRKALNELFGLNRDVIVVDLHTTSSKSIPFLVVSKRDDNIQFAQALNVPQVVGLEAYLRGPMLNYIDELGYRTLAFEAGQHDDPESVSIHKAFIYRVLGSAEVIKPSTAEELNRNGSSLLDDCELSGSFEVVYRKAIGNEDEFRMSPGFQNFSPIQKGDLLATDQNGEIRSEFEGNIFMPLYQNAGEDGFFVVRESDVS